MLTSLLHHKHPLVRKAAQFALKAPRRLAAIRRDPQEYQLRPPVFANSFPKSGTHLLHQVVEAFPGLQDFGAFLASLTSSFAYRPRSRQSSLKFIESFLPGELVRGHLMYDPDFAACFARRNVAHYFIYRDPRDVVVSEAHYLRSMNTWHRLHSSFKNLSVEQAIALSIRGLPDPQARYPDVAERFREYQGWLADPQTFAVRFEDLRGESRQATVEQMVAFYQQRSPAAGDLVELTARAAANVVPTRSHTFRSGKAGGWREVFTPELKDQFRDVAGPLLVELGYEQDLHW